MSRTLTYSIVNLRIRKHQTVAFACFCQIFHARLLSGLILENQGLRAVERKNVPTLNFFSRESTKQYRRPTCQVANCSSTKKQTICIFCVIYCDPDGLTSQLMT